MAEAIKELQDILRSISENLAVAREKVDNLSTDVVEISRPHGSADEAPEDDNEELESLIGNLEIAESSGHEDSLSRIDSSLSDSARPVFETSSGSLEPENLKNFLDATYRKKVGILTIARDYTTSVEELIQQLIRLKDNITQARIRANKSHKDYMDEQKKIDNNLIDRIQRLVNKMTTELEEERVAAARRN